MVIGTENRCERLEENSLGKTHPQIDPEGGQSPAGKEEDTNTI